MEQIYPKDKFGQSLEINDLVVYSRSSRGIELHIGVISSITKAGSLRFAQDSSSETYSFKLDEFDELVIPDNEYNHVVRKYDGVIRIGINSNKEQLYQMIREKLLCRKYNRQ